MKYRVAEVLIDKDGNFSVNYLGLHAGQDGEEYGYGGISVGSDIDSNLDYLKKRLAESKDRYIDTIKKKEDNANT